MRSNRENGTLTIYLEGRIDTGNAPEHEEEIMRLIDESEKDAVVFDASALDYISSAGLRVLLKARKKKKTAIPVLEVSPEVYDIFETTGFTDLLDVKKRLKEISVDGYELIGAGGFGKVYRIDDETIVKVYNEGVSQDFVDKERESSRSAFKLGVPTAISFHTVRCGNQFGVIYELFNTKTIAQLLSGDPSRVQELGAKTALKLKELHGIEVPENSGFRDRKELFLEWIDQIADAMTEEEFKKVKDYISSIPDRKTFLHGDYNSKNIMLQDDEILLIDIGDAGYGHPIFDIAMLLLAYVILPKRPMDEERRRGLLGFDPALADGLLGVMLGTYFGFRSPDEIGDMIKRTMPVAFLYMAYQGVSTGLTDAETMVNSAIRPQMIPMIDAGLTVDFDAFN